MRAWSNPIVAAGAIVLGMLVSSLPAQGVPPGLQLGEPVCEWEIFGTPTTRGTYNFTVQIAP
jgi:hypothetical protein